MTTPTTETNGQHALAYRPDIDGLRALAVLGVILFHAGVPGFSGGYVGVDVFFVLSGYLISGIIVRALQREAFSFRDFYARRINRIFPALLIVLAGTFLLGWYLLYQNEFVSLGRHVAAGATFLSNALLVQETGYFDIAAEKKPLLHLWSLAIEEQFYLFWPLLLVVSWRLRERFASPPLIVGVVSFFLALLAVYGDYSVSAFFLPFARLWELVAGFCLFYAEMKSGRTPAPGRANVMAAGGLAMILLSIVFIGRGVTWPGVWTLIPVVGTSLILAAGSACWVNRSLLSNRALVVIGLISYPLYLWHWPLLSFARFIDPKETSKLLLAGAIALSFVLAFATYRLIEFPIRSRRYGRGRRALVLGGCLAAVGVLGAFAAKGRIRVSMNSPEIRSVQEALADWRFPGGGFKSGALVENVIKGGSQDTVLFGGDSHMEQYWPRVDSLVRSSRESPSAIFVTVRACPMFPGVGRKDVRECDDAYPAIMRRARAPGITTVVLTSFWEDFFRRDLIFRRGDPDKRPLRLDEPGMDSVFTTFQNDIARLVNDEKKVFVVLTIPTGANDEFDPRTWLPGRLDPDREVKVIPRISRQEYEKRADIVLSRVRQAASAGGAIVIDPVPDMCSANFCSTVDSVGKPLYMDSRHLRTSIARSRAVWIDPTLK